MRTIVTIIGVILSAAMFTAVTTFATTLMTHLQRVTAYLDGAYYLGVHNVDADTLASMRADSDIEAFSTAEVLGYAEVTVNNSNKPYLYVRPSTPAFRTGCRSILSRAVCRKTARSCSSRTTCRPIPTRGPISSATR
ncbi:MAG: hypothetical protein ACLRR6_04690 [Oscillospiraceae bacterium]